MLPPPEEAKKTSLGHAFPTREKQRRPESITAKHAHQARSIAEHPASHAGALRGRRAEAGSGFCCGEGDAKRFPDREGKGLSPDRRDHRTGGGGVRRSRATGRMPRMFAVGPRPPEEMTEEERKRRVESRLKVKQTAMQRFLMGD